MVEFILGLTLTALCGGVLCQLLRVYVYLKKQKGRGNDGKNQGIN